MSTAPKLADWQSTTRVAMLDRQLLPQYHLELQYHGPSRDNQAMASSWSLRTTSAKPSHMVLHHLLDLPTSTNLRGHNHLQLHTARSLSSLHRVHSRASSLCKAPTRYPLPNQCNCQKNQGELCGHMPAHLTSLDIQGVNPHTRRSSSLDLHHDLHIHGVISNLPLYDTIPNLLSHPAL